MPGFFEERILGRRVAVFLTGDLHFYKRHEREDGTQKIVSGGGGAFLHPTHAPETARLRGGFEERACYPDVGTSRRLTWWNLVFPFLNPRYLPIPAVLYMMSAWFASATFGPADVGDIGSALRAALHGAVRDPINGLWLLLFVSAFVFFTDTHVRWYRVLGGITHAVAHLGAAFALGWLALVVTTQWLGLGFGGIRQMLASAAITFVGGGIAGSVVLGLYLFVSLRVFGRHANEAFSSLRIQDYKQWLRLRIDAAGALTIHAIGIDRVPRKWREARSGARSRIQPDDATATPPRLGRIHASCRHLQDRAAGGRQRFIIVARAKHEQRDAARDRGCEQHGTQPQYGLAIPFRPRVHERARRSRACARSQAMITRVSSPLSRDFHAGITPCAPFVIVCSIIARSPLPQVQIASESRGAPRSGLPSPVAPWQAEHTVNSGAPAAALA